MPFRNVVTFLYVRDQGCWYVKALALDHLSETNELIRPAKELKQCLLEMLLHSCMSEIRGAGM